MISISSPSPSDVLDDRYLYCQDCGRRIHKKTSPDTCPDCGGNMVNVKKYDPDEPWCHTCGMQFDSKRGKGKHITSVHKNGGEQ